MHAWPFTRPTEIAATESWSGGRASWFWFESHTNASCSATSAPLIAAVRVPPSASSTSQSSVIVRSPNAVRSVTARSERPISRWISCARPPVWLERGVRSPVARGSMPYSAVTQPFCCPRSQPGTRSSTLAVHSTRVLPIDTSAEPSACVATPRCTLKPRIWRGLLPSWRWNAAGSAGFASSWARIAAGLRVTGSLRRRGRGLAHGVVRTLEPRQVGLVHHAHGRKRAAEEGFGHACEAAAARLVAQEEVMPRLERTRRCEQALRGEQLRGRVRRLGARVDQPHVATHRALQEWREQRVVRAAEDQAVEIRRAQLREVLGRHEPRGV